MKTKLIGQIWFIIVFHVVFTAPLSAATFYLAANGSDTNDGLSQQTPWRTLVKINSLSRSVTDNSTFLFQRGDTFRGEIRLAQSTINAKLGAYGFGENPVISGSVEIGGWQVYQGNVYVADVSAQLPSASSIKQLFVNNQRMLLARYPNVTHALPDPDEGWLEVGSSSNKHSFNDPVLGASLKSDNYWNGANLRIRSFSWLFETRKVVSSTQDGTIVIDVDLTETLAEEIQAGWGYYLDNLLGELDHENEWYFDAVAQKVYLYAPAGVNPNSVKVEGAVYDLGCSLFWHYHDTTIDGLTFRHQNEDGIQINQSDRVVIRNCTFENIGHNGVNMAWNSVGIIIEENLFTDILEFGIKFIASIPSGGSVIRGNTIQNTAVIAGYGGSGVARACGIRTYGVTGLEISGNIIEDTGYVGMQLEGGSHLVENNIVRRSLLTLDDGGGIFINSPSNIVRSNIVTDTWGNRGPSSGTHNGKSFDNNQMGMGVFFQPYLNGNVIENNTFANNRSHGIYLDRATNTAIQNNISFNNGSGAYHGSQMYLSGTGSNQNNVMSDNTLVSSESVQYAMHTNDAFDIGSYDNTIICNQKKLQSIRNGAADLSLPQWQSLASNRDPNAVDCPVLTGSEARILINDSNSARTYDFGSLEFFGVQGDILPSTGIIAPYSSLLIFQERSVFYSLSTLMLILQSLTGYNGVSAEILDVDQDGIVSMTDAIKLIELLKN